VGGYAVCALLASVFYVIWFAVEVGPGSFRDRLIAALVLCVIGGFSATLVVMTLPWALIVLVRRAVRLSGPVYFACAGMLLMILVGCAASSLSPKPLFIEDQTFMQGVFIALQRQGLCLALVGAMFGFAYWFLAEKNARRDWHRHPNVA
jgi:hypothetical protein